VIGNSGGDDSRIAGHRMRSASFRRKFSWGHPGLMKSSSARQAVPFGGGPSGGAVTVIGERQPEQDVQSTSAR
jgi:hypothetical protein